jgi:iron-sulfur cluster assembly protein/iron-sulfur cluster insertion protein
MRTDAGDPARNLRLFIETGGCSGLQYGMAFDDTKPGDAAFESEGVAIVVDPKSLEHLDGTTIDFDDGLHGKGFEIKNPNAHSTCGCGKSFN